jgi:GNAT superfamily N-acetyltransferase
MNPEIRRLRADEWTRLKQVRLAALADAPYAFSKPLARARDLTDEDWQRVAREGAGGEVSCGVLAWAGDRPVGLAFGLPDADDPHRAYLVSMWVAPDHRGGPVAEQLLLAVEDWARGRGARELQAGVTGCNERAAAFYAKRGYLRRESCGPRHAATEGCEIVLAKALDRPAVT